MKPRELGFVREDRLSIEVEVLRLEELLRRPLEHDPTKPTRTRFHNLLLIEAGIASHQVDFSPYRVAPGDLLAIPEGHVHAFDPARSVSGPYALFTSGFVNDCGLNACPTTEAIQLLLHSGVHLHLSRESFTRAKQAFEVLASYTHSPPTTLTHRVVSAAFLLFFYVVAGLPEIRAAVAEQVPKDPLVARFLKLLETRFTAEHQAASYARALNVSLRTLDRHLMNARGSTTRQSISARVVLEAKRYLARRDLLIKSVAESLGFSEPQNFTRFFRAQTGLSPEAFRKSLDSSNSDGEI